MGSITRNCITTIIRSLPKNALTATSPGPVLIPKAPMPMTTGTTTTTTTGGNWPRPITTTPVSAATNSMSAILPTITTATSWVCSAMVKPVH